MVRSNRIKTVEELLYWEPMLAKEQKEQLAAVERPERIAWIKIPADLSGLSFEDLVRFWNCKTTEDLFDTTAQVLLHVRSSKHVPVLKMLGLVNFVGKELERINELWSDIHTSHTPEEIQAGCNELNFGVFGILDWYAKRMGIADHDQVLKTPWIRIYQCMKNDSLEAAYRRRLNDIISRKHKK